MGKAEQNDRIRTLTALLKVRLSKKRFTHSVNVARAAWELSELWGADSAKAYLAGLLHDCCKEMPYPEQKALMERGPFPVSDAEWQSKPVWHGIAGAVYMMEELGIEDPDVLSAARWHTVAHANMTLLEEIVYMADLISTDRSYRDVERFRKLARTDLQKAMYEAIVWATESVVKKGNQLPVSTVEAYNYYLTLFAEREKAKPK